MLKRIYTIVALVSILCLTCCIAMPAEEKVLPSQEPAVQPPAQEEKFEGGFGFSEAGQLKIPGQAIDVDLRGTYAYLTDDLGQMYIIDFSDKREPRIVGKLRDIHSANIVIVQDDFAYISFTSWNSEPGRLFTECGFKIIDIKRPESPRTVGQYLSGSGTEKWVQVMFIQKDYAYINSTEILEGKKVSQLEIVDISDKKNPKLVSCMGIEGQPWSVYVQGDYAYINSTIYDNRLPLGQEGRFFVVDISSKENPRITGSCRVPESSAGMHIDSNYAYISSNTLEFESGQAESYLQIVDIKDKNNPRPIGKCTIPGQGWEVDKVSNYILVSDLSGGVHAVDISHKESPKLVDSFYTSGTSYDINVEGNYGYIADGFSGLVVLALSGGERMHDAAAGEINRAPYASFEIFGDKTCPEQFQAGVPIYFSAGPSYGLDGSPLSYSWDVEGSEYEGEEISHVFNLPGIYEIRLAASDGELTGEFAENLIISENKNCIVPLHKDSLEVEIEYTLANLGQGEIKDIQCFISVPQTYEPFQTISEIRVQKGDYQVIYDQNFNKMLHIDYGDLVVKEAGEATVLVTLDVEMISFEYADIDYSSLYYEPGDSDLILYTMADLYIDSDHPVIIKKAESIIRGETRPVVIMELLYYYVANLLRYDFRRAEDPRYPLMYASEIIRERKGVCADYAILYTALLRASGIPSRIASGIPIYAAQLEGGQISIGHAWVEVKIPQFGWVPVDITMEDSFMAPDKNMNLAIERGPGFLHRNMTMDWPSYYFDGFAYSWEGEDIPEIEQSLSYRVIE